MKLTPAGRELILSCARVLFRHGTSLFGRQESDLKEGDLRVSLESFMLPDLLRFSLFFETRSRSRSPEVVELSKNHHRSCVKTIHVNQDFAWDMTCV